jgi:hypothetical protein
MVGQFLGQAESPSPSFFEDLRKSLPGASVTPHPHYTSAAAEPPAAPPEALMKAWMVLVWRDGHLPPLSSLYSSPYLALQRSLRVFRLKIGDLSLFIALNRPIQWITLVLPSPHTVDGLLGSWHSYCGVPSLPLPSVGSGPLSLPSTISPLRLSRRHCRVTFCLVPVMVNASTPLGCPVCL